MTTPEEPRPGIDLGKSAPEPAQADPTMIARPSGYGGAGEQVPGTPPSAYPSYPSYPAYPAQPVQQPQSSYPPQPGYPAPYGYPGQPSHPAQPPYPAQPGPYGNPAPPQGGFTPAPPPGPYGRPYPGAYVPPPTYVPPSAPTPHGYVEPQTPIFSIMSFSCAAASLAAMLMLCGFPALLTGPAGIVLGIIGHQKGESLGIGAAIVNGVLLALMVLVMVFVVGALWAV